MGHFLLENSLVLSKMQKVETTAEGQSLHTAVTSCLLINYVSLDVEKKMTHYEYH